MKKLSQLIVCLILLSTFFVGCNKTSDTTDDPLINIGVDPDCPLSPLRTGIERHVFSGTGFECTEQGAYFMVDRVYDKWILYVDHSSDTMIKLCGRPDCEHKDDDCNACIINGFSLRYINGYLYTYGKMTKHGPDGIIRMNLDGTEQKMVFDMKAFRNEKKYKGWESPRIYNNVLYFCCNKIDENGNKIFDSYYYKLDGTMDEPIKTDYFFKQNDGEKIIGYQLNESSDEFIYVLWDEDESRIKELFRDDQWRYNSYIGEKSEYYVEDGIVYERTYPDEVRVLFDTGIRGKTHCFYAFPDCIMISSYKLDEEQLIVDNNITFDFYGWRYNHLGSVSFDVFKSYFTNPVVGETPDKIILTDDLLPKYYIDKSDFGTGNIEIHEFNLPEDFYEPIPDHMEW